jgi:hypothetical protein
MARSGPEGILMDQPNLNDYTRVREGHVLVEYAPPVDGSPGPYASVGCLEGDFSVNIDTSAVEDNIVNWCTIGITEFLASAQPGEQTVTLNGTLVMLLGDNGYMQAHNDARAKITGFWRITWSDGNTPENVLVDNFRGFFTQFQKQARQDGVSVSPFNVRVTEQLSGS